MRPIQAPPSCANHRPRRRLLLATVPCAAALALTAGQAQAQRYPERPITLVAPFAPGGNIDITARVLAGPLGQLLGQPVVVENRPGAGGMVGAAWVARAKPDGYTLLLGHSGTHATVPAVNRKMPYDPVRDFTILGGLTLTPSVLVTSAALPAMNIRQFADFSAKQGVGATIASAGVGSFNHLTIELLKHRVGMKAVHVPYKGSAPAITDLLGGQVQAMTDQLSTSLPYIRDGKFRAVAQFGPVRSPLLPDVPTAIEQGFDKLEAGVFTGVFAPAGVPADIQQKLAAALEKVRSDPAIVARYRELGAQVLEMDQAAFGRYVAEEAALWKKLATEANISVDQ